MEQAPTRPRSTNTSTKEQLPSQLAQVPLQLVTAITQMSTLGLVGMGTTVPNTYYQQGPSYPPPLSCSPAGLGIPFTSPCHQGGKGVYSALGSSPSFTNPQFYHSPPEMETDGAYFQISAYLGSLAAASSFSSSYLVGSMPESFCAVTLGQFQLHHYGSDQGGYLQGALGNLSPPEKANPKREGGVVGRRERRKEGSKASLSVGEMGKTSLFPELTDGNEVV